MPAITWQGVSLNGTEAQVTKLRFTMGDFTSVGRLFPMHSSCELPSFRTSVSSRKYVCSSSKGEHPNANGSCNESDPELTGFPKRGTALRVALICGGPSAERGISLNSARSVLDHLQSEDIAVSCYYLDQNLFPYRISLAQMYSNTPSDFDYKLGSMTDRFTSKAIFTNHLREAADIVFPLIHGQFGEDGGIQEMLEEASIPFVGTGAAAACRAFDKFKASTELSYRGFATIPSFLIEGPVVDRSAVVLWFEAKGLELNTGRVVVKPASSGSSIGVSVAHGVAEAVEQAGALISEGLGDRVVIEVFIEDGKEFTAIVIDLGLPGNPHPVTLLPTEVELCNENLAAEANDAIFNYRRKYLPTNQVLYHTPPRFSNEAIQEIRAGAMEVFKQLDLQDFARIDGWLLPPSKVDSNKHKQMIGEFESGTVVFTDINLVSGMEQTSFLFQQSAQVGISHARVLRMILLHACHRFLSLSSFWALPYVPFQKSFAQSRRQKVHVVFGGETSERQVSLQSGTNVWLNLRKSSDLDVIPFLLCSYGSKVGVQSSLSTSILSQTIWKLSYAVLLRHTVEEVIEACLKASKTSSMAAIASLQGQVISELEATGDYRKIADLSLELPMRLTMTEWIDEIKKSNAVVFIAVHGGAGENGTLQEILEASNIAYTGSGLASSRICIDKEESAVALAHLSSKGVLTIPKDAWNTADILKGSGDWRKLWESMLRKLNARTICAKPASDGCSTGVARLCCAEDLCTYLDAIENRLPRLLPGSLSKEHGAIEMPDPPPEKLIFEQFIETAKIKVSSESVEVFLKDMKGSKWVEITGGVIGKAGEMHALNPSVTIKEQGDILSLEEKFQGGTGINLTPPPSSLISMDAVNACKKHLELVANVLQLEGFARIDAFVHVNTGEIMVIEVNTVPGMTPSTVLIHQALAEVPPMFPHEMFKKIVELAITRHKTRGI